MESMDHDVAGATEPLQSTTMIPVSPANDDTCNIKCTNSSWKGSGNKRSTRVSTTGDTAEVTVSTVAHHRKHYQQQHTNYESSWSSSFTSRPTDGISYDAHRRNDTMVDMEEDIADGPLPNEIPRFIYARTKTYTTTINANTTSARESVSSRSNYNRTVSPPQNETKSILRRFFRRPRRCDTCPEETHHRSPHHRIVDNTDDDDKVRTRMQLTMIDDSENSELIGGGMTLVSL